MKKESNEVVVKVPQKNEPAYTIEKLQRIEETGSFTKEELTGMIGQTVSYEIIVNNVGDVTLTFKNFVDTECEGIIGGPGPSGEIKSGQSATWTCFHVLTSTGTWPNVAKIEGNLGTGPKESNKVVVNVPPEPKLAIEKRQMLPGEPAFTASELTGTIGQVVSYEIVVTNVGNVPVTPVELHRHPVCGDQRRRSRTRRRRLHDLHLHAPDHEHRPVRERGGRRRHSAPRPGCSGEGGIQPGGRQSRRIAAGPQHRARKAKSESAMCAVAPGTLALKGASGSKRNTFTVEVKAAGPQADHRVPRRAQAQDLHPRRPPPTRSTSRSRSTPASSARDPTTCRHPGCPTTPPARP